MLTSLTHTTTSSKAPHIVRKWHLVDAKGMVLGKVATKVATLLQGKHKVSYVDHLDTGDAVVVINAAQVVVTGRKAVQKVYTNYSGYPNGLRSEAFEVYFARLPHEVVRRAISGMLPKNKLRDRRLARLHVYPTDAHQHQKDLA